MDLVRVAAVRGIGRVLQHAVAQPVALKQEVAVAISDDPVDGMRRGGLRSEKQMPPRKHQNHFFSRLKPPPPVAVAPRIHTVFTLRVPR